ncbi:unnamed protein product [Cuscuta campestris]|uniref:Uncharacterized protein n=1 Tax=Cuscuta campestris TaxID=132261 RepID=A0A484MYQ4_9ASTE|nr:unnamed protein product [Cuscuta campestris]
MAPPNDNPWGGAGGYRKAAEERPTRLGGPSPKLSRKMSEKFERGVEKTKVAANKVKEGASIGINWLKVKYNKHKLITCRKK